MLNKKQGIESLFCPYKLALEIKELGFYEPCFGWYQSSRLKIEAHPLNFGDQTYMRNEDCFAPTFSQAFKFFRDEYSLYSHVRESFAFDNTLEFVAQINGSYVNHGIADKPINRFETYEEAELECLNKLIEIVKNK